MTTALLTCDWLGYGHVVSGDASDRSASPEDTGTEEIWDGERWIIVKRGKQVDSDSFESSEPGEPPNWMFLPALTLVFEVFARRLLV